MEQHAFSRWLHGRDYRASTIRATLTDARQLARHAREGTEAPRRLRPTAKRLLAWADEEDVSLDADVRDLAEQLDAMAARARTLGGRQSAKARKRRAESWTDGDWSKLVASIRTDDTPAGAVLQVLAATGLRIGDVLRLDVESIRRGRRSGRLLLEVKGGKERVLDPAGAPEAWGALYRACHDYATVAHACSPGGDGNPEADGAAYRAVARRLGKHVTATGVEGRAHLHRLRRTVAVQALRVSGGDVEAVRRLLGQESQQTTLRYLDEAMPERDAELARAVAQRFAGKVVD